MLKRHLLIPRVSRFHSLIKQMHLTIPHKAIIQIMSRDWDKAVILVGMCMIQITRVTPGLERGSCRDHKGEEGCECKETTCTRMGCSQQKGAVVSIQSIYRTLVTYWAPSQRIDYILVVASNMDQFHMAHQNNEKANLLCAWARHSKLDGVFVQETGINWTAMPQSGRLEEMMKTEAAMRMVAAHNKHENLGWRQWGGTAVVAYGDLAVRVSETGKDPTGLGRWCFMQCKGRDDHTIWIIMAYNPVYSARLHTQMVYSQQQQYFELKGDNVNPHKAFLQDFEVAL